MERNQTTADDSADRWQQAAMQALNRGDGSAAVQAFEQALIARPQDAELWLGKAYALVQSSDTAAAHLALDRSLQIQPRLLRALILKADLFDHVGQSAAAASFCRAALKVAEQSPDLPDSLIQQVQRVARRAGELEAAFARSLESVALSAQAEDAAGSTRLSESVAILLGRQPEYRQEPLHLRIPGLAAIPFHDRSAFPWLPELESKTAAIRAEAAALLAQPEVFDPYIRPDPSRPVLQQSGLYNNPDWGACFLVRNGQPDPTVIARCPATWAAVQATPLVQAPGRSPSILFSRLRPHTHIPAHHGFYNSRLIVHLPLIVPAGCRFRVGARTQAWEEGKAWVFDDTIEHEAWNDSDHDRVILLFEVWQPALSQAERRWVTALFQALDSQGRAAPAGSI